MSVYFSKDRGRWLFDFQHRKERFAGYCVLPEGPDAANKSEARRCEEIEKGRVKTAERPAPQIRAGETTLAQAMALFVTTRQGTPNWENARAHVRELLTFFGADKNLAAITTEDIWRYVGFSRAQPVMVWTGGKRKPTGGKADQKFWKATDKTRADSTTNRYLATLKTALSLAHEALDQNRKPLLAYLPKFPDLDEPQYAPRPVPLEILSAIVNEGPEHLAKAIVLTQLFGFRKMEALTVRASQVDFNNSGIWLDGQQTKGKRAEFLHASPDALELLRRYVAEANAAGVETLVFYRPAQKTGKKAKGVAARSIKDIRKPWARALKAHGLEGEYTFHNTKASFVTNVGRNASGPTTQKLARHKNAKTTERYLMVADLEKREAARQVSGELVRHGFDVAPAPSSPKRESQTAAAPEGEKAAKGLERLVGTIGFEPTTLRPPVFSTGEKVLYFQRFRKR